MAVLVQIRNAHKSYGDQVLLDGAEATLTDDVKVGFVGRNGAGKSTLLKVLLGEEELDRGEIVRHPKLQIGYLRRHVEEFIAKNKARASTATRARSKSKQLEKLEVIEIASDEPTANIQAPRVEPRKGAAVRCRDMAMGYDDRQIADDINLEIDHGSRAAIVGDNGQGK